MVCHAGGCSVRSRATPRNPDPPETCQSQHSPQRQAGDRRGQVGTRGMTDTQRLSGSHQAPACIHAQEGAA